MREHLTTLLELIGAALVVAGVAMWSLPLALIVAGVLFIAAAVVLARPVTKPAPPTPGEVTS